MDRARGFKNLREMVAPVVLTGAIVYSTGCEAIMDEVKMNMGQGIQWTEGAKALGREIGYIGEVELEPGVAAKASGLGILLGTANSNNPNARIAGQAAGEMLSNYGDAQAQNPK